VNGKKVSVLAALAVVAMATGVTAQYVEPDALYPRSDLWFVLVATTLSFLWYYFDSEEFGYRRGLLLNMAIIVIGILAFPYYFFRTRGFRGGLVYTGLFLLVVVAWSLLSMGGAYAVYYGLQSP